MTKEQYLLIREKEEIPIEIWYEFFLEKGGSNIGLEVFTDLFTNMLLGKMVITTFGPKLISLETALRAFYKHYNQKFE